MYLLNRPADAMRFLDGKADDQCAHYKSSSTMLAVVLLAGCSSATQGKCIARSVTKCGEDAGCSSVEGRLYSVDENCQWRTSGCRAEYCIGTDRATPTGAAGV